MDLRGTFRRELSALWSEGRGPSLVVVAATWGLLVGSRMIYPVVLPHLRASYDMSLAVAGLLISVLWLSGAIGQLPGGALADRYSERGLMAASTLVVAVALALVVAAATPLVLFVATAIWGLGLSLYPIARITFLSRIYPDRLGRALGVTMATGDVGQTALPPIAGVLAVAVAWQAGLGFAIPVLVVAGIAIWVVVPERRPPTPGSDSGSSAGVRRVLAEFRSPTMAFMAGILFLYIFIWQSFTAFYPTYLLNVKGLSSSVTSALFGLFFALGVVVKPVSGAAYDRFGMRLSLVAVLALPVAGFLLLPVLDGVAALALVTAAISSMLGTGTITQSYLAEAFSEEMQGTGLGVIRTLTATLGATGPVVFGLVAEYGYFDEGYLLLAGIVAVVVLLTLRMPDG